MKYDNDTYVRNIAYNAKGQRILIAFGNDVMTRYAYDDETFRLLRQRSEKYTRSVQGERIFYNPVSGNNRQDDGYQYDLIGNILEINHRKSNCGVGGTDSLDRSFDYDPLNRLLEATGRENVPSGGYPMPGWDDTTRDTTANSTVGYTRRYRYDKLGNIDLITQVGTNSFTRIFKYPLSGGSQINNKLSQVLIGSNTTNYTYDDNGNQLTEHSNRHFKWDAKDQLVLFKDQAGTSEPTVAALYLYDSQGNRVKKLVRKNGKYEIRTYIDGVFEYFTNEKEEQNTVHIMDDKSRIATLRIGDAMGDTTPAIKFVLENNIGSSSIQLDQSATVVNEQEYYPFGETSFGSHGKKRYQYVGKERDEESGMYYYGARYYSPWIGRFVSVDPLAGDYGHLTPYQNASNSPVASLDIDGLQTPEETKGPTSSDTETKENDKQKTSAEEKNKGNSDSSTKDNIYIFIGSQGEIDDYYSDDVGDNGTYYQIVSSNIIDAANQLNKYLGEKSVENVVLRVHGAPGKINLSQGLPVDYKSLILFNQNGNSGLGASANQKEFYNNQIRALRFISSKIKDNGKLVISGCNAGANTELGTEGTTLGEELRKLTDDRITLYLNQDESTRLAERVYSDQTEFFKFQGDSIPHKGTYDKDIRITGPLTVERNYEKGWIEISPNEPQRVLKDDKKGVKGILYLNAYHGRKPITIK